jgi:DNA-binding PadR family transcriptional regulator
MPEPRADDYVYGDLRGNLKVLGNRYSIEILEVLSPTEGAMVPEVGWDEIVEGILELMGYPKPTPSKHESRSQKEAEYEKRRKRFASGGTLYETMNKLVKAGFVQAIGARGQKQRSFMITHEGRLVLSALRSMLGPSAADTEFQRAAKVLLKHKNFIRPLPAQQKFLDEIGDIGENLIIQMPPGSGKTFLAMIITLTRLQKGSRVLYVTPYISINRQLLNEYGNLFEELGYSVARLDGTTTVTDGELEQADLIVGIYESILSSYLRKANWTEKIELVIADEITQLDSGVDKLRPSNLSSDRSVKVDMLVTLFKQSSQIVTLSSRFGDTDSLAEWLNARVFRPSVRLCPDEFIVEKIDDNVKIRSRDGTHVDEIQREYPLEAVIDHIDDAKNKSILVVVGYRFKAEQIAGAAARRWARPLDESVTDRILGSSKGLPLAERLKEVLHSGIAFHHAGLDSGVRGRLEDEIRKNNVRFVVSTTGITAGTSFPFDAVVILFERSMGFLVTRSKYLQIAGRIGEYYLAQRGGSVYLVFESPTRQFKTADQLAKTLLHEPLTPLEPGPVNPVLMANLIIRQTLKQRIFKVPNIKKEVLSILRGSYRGSKDRSYETYISDMFDDLVGWFETRNCFVETKKGFKLSKNMRAAAESGLDSIHYAEHENEIAQLHADDETKTFLDILLEFPLPQSARPRTYLPTQIELRSAGLDEIEDWYEELVNRRQRIKQAVLEGWTQEKSVPQILDEAIHVATEESSSDRPSGGSDIEEGDLMSLASIGKGISTDFQSYQYKLGNMPLMERFRTLSIQMEYGLRSDIAATTLPILVIQLSEKEKRHLSQLEMRTLYDNGYQSISDILKKDVDASKKGLARNRFAKNCGLEFQLAKKVYKSALNHVRQEMQE